MLFLLLLLPLFFSISQAQQTDLTALLDLRSSLGIRSVHWPKRADPCTNWTGISCRSNRVISINLSSLTRTRLGRLNPRFTIDGLKKLDLLESFNSTGFSLPGPIPVWFVSELPKSLIVLVISSAFVNGSVPYNIGQLGNLTVLDLSNNFISGSVPTTIGTLSKLQRLNLSKNRFTGSIPESLWLLELNVFDVSGNNLSGVLPKLVQAEVKSDVGVSIFNMSNNLYYGSVSSVFGKFLRRFDGVDISRNYFQGVVPLDDNSNNHSSGLNCFRSASNQRNMDDCEEFYRLKKVAYIGPLYPKLAEPPTSSTSRKKKSQLWKYILIGFFGFTGLVITAVFMFVFCCVRAKPHTSDRAIGVRGVASRVGPSSPNVVVSQNRMPREQAITHNFVSKETFIFEQLVQATLDFSDANLIKKGHSGDLYNGILENGFCIVVKRIDIDNVMHKGYFAELESIAKCSHIRIVPFLGQCLEKETEKFMVYKKIKHGDLFTALYNNIMKKKNEDDDDGLKSLDWITRSKIAVGVAEALSFLHHECKPPIVHRDVQASSILLDDKFEVRLGSLSDVCTETGDGTHNVLTRILRRSQTSEQSTSGSSTATCAYDIYCFGKVLLELVTGKLGLSGSTDPTTTQFIDHTLHHIGIYDKESITKIIDPSLILDEDLSQEAWAVMVIARSCLNPTPSKRPIARYVLKALENPLKILRLYSGSNYMGLRTLSSRASWHGAFMGSSRDSSDNLMGLRRSGTDRSQGSLGDCSFSHKRRLMEIFPDPITCTSTGDDLR